MQIDRTTTVEPPGSFIKLELAAREWTQRDLAFILGQSEQQLTPLLSGKRAITADMARLLGAAFGVPAVFFSNLQTEYELQNARVPDAGVLARAQLQKSMPLREMIRRGWLQDGDADLLEIQAARFFEVANDDSPRGTVSFAAKRSHCGSITPTQLAWLYRVRQLARMVEAPVYQRDALVEAINRLRPLMILPDAVSEAPQILMDAGVRLVVVESLPGSKIDGVCTWLDDNSPVIGLSTLHDRIDNFWFVLRHEIEHVLNGDGKDGEEKVDYLSDFNDDEDIQEKLANDAAAEFCVRQTSLDSFYKRKFPYFSEKDVLSFARLNGIHPALVIGQLQHRLKRHDYLRRYQVPIRKYLIDSTLADGWGSNVNAQL